MYGQMYFVHLYGLHVNHDLVDLSSFGSQGVRPTPGLTSSTQVVCVFVRAYTSTNTHHTNTRKNREMYKTKPLSLPLPKYSLPHQQQALTMNKLKKPPLPIPPHPRIQVLRNTCDTRQSCLLSCYCHGYYVVKEVINRIHEVDIHKNLQ